MELELGAQRENALEQGEKIMRKNWEELEVAGVERWTQFLLSSASDYADKYTVFGTLDPADRQAWGDLDATQQWRLRGLTPFLQATWLTQMGQPNKALISGQRPALYYIVSRWSNWALGIRSRLRTSSQVSAFAMRFDTPATAARIVPRLRSMNLITDVKTDGVKGIAPTNLCLRNAFITSVTFNINEAMASAYVGGPDYLSVWGSGIKEQPAEATAFSAQCFKEHEKCFPRVS